MTEQPATHRDAVVVGAQKVRLASAAKLALRQPLRVSNCLPYPEFLRPFLQAGLY